jgi:hypothetical protein
MIAPRVSPAKIERFGSRNCTLPKGLLTKSIRATKILVD